MKNSLAWRSLLPTLLLGAALLIPFAQTARASSDPSDTDPSVFGDGIYKKFGLDLGFAGRTHRFAVYTYGSGTSSTPFTALDISAPSSTIGGVLGDVALAGVYSRLSAAGNSGVIGDRYEQTTSTETTSGNAVLWGTRFSNTSTNTLLNGGVTSLKNVSNTAAGLSATGGSPTNISLSGGSMTYNNNPFGGKYVMKLTNFVLDNHSTLTLNGVSGSAFVINVSNNFSLNNGSKIVLSGGLTPSDVLFNVRGSSGTFSITGDSFFQGTLLAYNSTSSTQRTLTISGNHTWVKGEILANKVVINNGGKVFKPRKMSRDQDDDEDEDEMERESHHGCD